MIVRWLLLICFCLISTGCWNSEELDHTAIVHGVGIDKGDDQLKISVEIVKPTGSGQENFDESGNIGNQLVLEIKTDTFLQGAREFIKYTKRRLNFSQVQAWIIGEKLASEDFVKSLDIIRRDQMIRLNSYMFMTKNNPTDILNTPTLYEDLVATELSSSFEQTNYTAEFAPITLREFYKFVEGPVPNAYVPLIKLAKVNEQLITEVNGTAIIKNGKKIGELNRTETAGLNTLLNQVNGGNIQTKLNENEKVSLELVKLKTKIDPVLKDGRLFVTGNTEVEGTLADNMTDRIVTEQFLSEVEEKLADHTKKTMNATLKKLQKEYKADIVQFGLKTYRKYPKEWREIESDWENIFANATVNIDVNVIINHKGLTKENIRRQKLFKNNPYNLNRYKESK